MKKIIKKYIFPIRFIINFITAISITYCNYLIYFDLDYKVFVLSFITLCFYTFLCDAWYYFDDVWVLGEAVLAVDLTMV